MSTKIEEIRGLNDPQKAYKWRVFLPNLALSNLDDRLNQFTGSIPGINGTPFDTLINSQTTALANSGRNAVGQALQFFNPSIQVEEVQGLPFSNVSREEFYEGGRDKYFASKETTAPFSIKFYQDASNRLPNYIYNWKRKVTNLDGTKNLPSEYKYPITVQLLNGKNKVSYEVQLLGCFPTETSGYDLLNSGENLKLTQEFSVDLVVPTPIFDIQGAIKQDLESKILGKANEEIGRDSNFTFDQ